MANRARRPPSSQPDPPVWKNPAWIAAIGGLVTAVAAAVGLIVANVGGDDGPTIVAGPSSVPETTTTTAAAVAPARSAAPGPETCGPATCEQFTATVDLSQNGVLLTKATDADLARAQELVIQKTSAFAVFDAFTNNGPVEVGVNHMDVVLAGKTSDPVVITDARVNVAAKTSIGSGPYVSTPRDGCGAPPEVRLMEIDLDADPPKVTLFRFDEQFKPIPVDRPWGLGVTREDLVELVVKAYSFEHDVEWSLDVDFSVAGRVGTMRIDNGGVPFRVTGITGANPRYTARESGVIREPQNDGRYGSCFIWPAGVPTDVPS